MNGYWGTRDVQKKDGTYEMGSLEGIKENLRNAINENKMENEVIQMPKVDDQGNPVLDDDGNPVMESKTMLELINDLTEGEALLATQSAIWAYANGHVDALNGKDGVVVVDPDGYKWNHDPTSDSKDGEALDDYGSARVDFLYKWLINLETEEESSVVIDEKNFIKELGITIKDKVETETIVVNSDNSDNDVYNVELNFKLAFVPGEKDNLLVHLTDKDNNPIKDSNGNPIVKYIASDSSKDHGEDTITPDDNGIYTLSGLQLSENTDFAFELRLEGTQYLENGVYVYAPVGGRKASQTFVGVAEGNRNVDVSMAVTARFNVEENNHVVVERVWHHEYDPVITPSDETPVPPTPPEETVTPPTPPAPPAEPAVVNYYEPPARAAVWTAPKNQRLANEEAVEIPEEPVPLANPAITGDDTGLWIMALMMIACCMVVINVFDKKRSHETF